MVMPEPVLPKGEVGSKQIPTGCYASFIYKGSYEYLQAVYDTIYAKKLPEMGCTLRDEPSYERYLNDPRNTKPENLLIVRMFEEWSDPSKKVGLLFF